MPHGGTFSVPLLGGVRRSAKNSQFPVHNAALPGWSSDQGHLSRRTVALRGQGAQHGAVKVVPRIPAFRFPIIPVGRAAPVTLDPVKSNPFRFRPVSFQSLTLSVVLVPGKGLFWKERRR